MIIFEANDGAMALDIIEEIDICALVREIIEMDQQIYILGACIMKKNIITSIAVSVADTQTFIDKIVENMDWKRL